MIFLQKFKVKNIRKAKTPCTDENGLMKDNTSFDKTTFKSAVGSLIYFFKVYKTRYFICNWKSRKKGRKSNNE